MLKVLGQLVKSNFTCPWSPQARLYRYQGLAEANIAPAADGALRERECQKFFNRADVRLVLARHVCAVLCDSVCVLPSAGPC